VQNPSEFTQENKKKESAMVYNNPIVVIKKNFRLKQKKGREKKNRK